jgi:glutamate synthase domain-containing protein 1
MCGIAGLMLRDAALQPRLGSMIEGMLTALAERGPDSAGVALYADDRDLTVVKDVGTAGEVCARGGIAGRSGYQAVGHTRMATESAVTRAHCHPFIPAPGLCVVHNGSFSNHATVRRELERAGTGFDSDNDSEVAARYIASRLAAGDGLSAALRSLMSALDGFYTLLVTTDDEFAVVRDCFACKPAVIAETPGYVAMGSEYQALADLPGVGSARVFEPGPGEVHVWSR